MNEAIVVGPEREEPCRAVVEKGTCSACLTKRKRQRIIHRIKVPTKRAACAID